MKQKISDMMESHYKEFIQALISIETGIENQQDLEDLYTYYMRTDRSCRWRLPVLCGA